MKLNNRQHPPRQRRADPCDQPSGGRAGSRHHIGLLRECVGAAEQSRPPNAIVPAIGLDVRGQTRGPEPHQPPPKMPIPAGRRCAKPADLFFNLLFTRPMPVENGPACGFVKENEHA